VEIIGAGRVGSSLAQRARAAQVPVGLVERGSGWDRLAGPADEPVLVCTRNDDLEGVLRATPEHRLADLVFTQNGMLHSFLTAHRLQACTRGILMFAAPERGGPITAGAPSPFCGVHAAQVVRWLDAVQIPAVVVTREAFANVELEKLLWACVFGLLCEAYGLTVDEVVVQHPDEVESLVRELRPLAAPVLGASLGAAEVTLRINNYSLATPGWRSSVKEWAWRNGWFVSAARVTGASTPLHTRLLEQVGRS
jgi:hypothetical protein